MSNNDTNKLPIGLIPKWLVSEKRFIEVSEATEMYKLEHVCRMSYGNIITIDNPTIAEQLAMDLMGIKFVYNHRCYRAKMKNKSFKRKHFNE